MDLSEKGIVILGARLLVAFAAFIGGTILWAVWPVAIVGAFPGLVASGVLAGKLSWWVAVCLTWVAGILIRGTATTTAKKE